VVCVAYNMSGILHELLLLSHSSVAHNPNYHFLRRLLIEAIIPCMSFISLTVFYNVCVHLIVGNNDHLEGRIDGVRTNPPQNAWGWLGGKGGPWCLLYQICWKKCMLDQVSYVTVLTCCYHHAVGIYVYLGNLDGPPRGGRCRAGFTLHLL